MKKIIAPLFLLALCLFSSCEARENDQELTSLLEKAETFYKEALASDDSLESLEFFFRAAVLWEEAVEKWKLDNGYIFYNIGNSWYKAEEIGKAIYYYRKAQLHIPGNDFLKANLNEARQSVSFFITEEEVNPLFRTLFFFHYDFSRSSRFIFLSLSLFVLAVLGAITLFKRNRLIINSISLVSVISLIFIISLILSSLSPDEGVVISSVTARKGDSHGFERSFTDDFPPGIEFSLLEERSGWFFIELRDGRTCWIPEESARIIK